MIVMTAQAAIECMFGTPVGLDMRHLTYMGEQIVAAPGFHAELSNLLAKSVAKADISEQGASKLYALGVQIPNSIWNFSNADWEWVFATQTKYDLTAHDAASFVLARKTSGTLFTCEDALLKACEQEGISVATIVSLP